VDHFDSAALVIRLDRPDSVKSLEGADDRGLTAIAVHPLDLERGPHLGDAIGCRQPHGDAEREQ
jgi:hypothetical protein